MKSISSIILLFALMLQSFHMGIVEIDFFINQEQIAAELCENKAAPEMNCQGHCQLKKQLEKKDKADDRAPVREFSLFVAPSVIDIKPYPLSLCTNHAIDPSRNECRGHKSEIFHPPAVSVC